MNVLVVSSYPPRHCGIGAYARDQVQELRAAGDRVTVLSPPDGDGDVRVPFFGGRPFLAAARIGGRFDLLLIHFQPALYYRPRAPLSKIATSLALLWLVVRRRRTRILVHEADRPMRLRPDYVLLGLALRAAPSLRFHTDAERRAVARDYGLPLRGAVIEHRVRTHAGVPRDEARRRLGVDGPPPVFVCPGFLQPSKGADRAVEAFASARGGSLYVVGSIRDATAENEAFVDALRRRCADVDGATLVERFVDDEAFDLWISAADVLVLAYRSSWSSGVLARAHAFGVPAVVCAAGGLPEQAGPADEVVGGDAELAIALRRVVERFEPTRGSPADPTGSRYAGGPVSPTIAKDRT